MPFSQYWRLIDTMARMSLRADATRFVLGYLWWILEPLLYVAVLYLVFFVILHNRQPDFFMHLMVGKLAFNWFSKSVTQAAGSIVAGRGLVGKINVPKSLFPIAVVQEGCYKQVTVFLFLFIVLLNDGYSVTASWFYLVPIMLVNYIMIIACALLAASIVCVIRDFQPLIGLGMLFLLFTSGIFWDVRAFSDAAKTDLILAANPMAFMLDAYRGVLMYDRPPDMLHLAVIAAGFGALICAMVLLMRRGSHYLALRALTA